MEAKFNYLKKFENVRDRQDLFRLNGGRVIVEILDEGEIKTAGGLIVAQVNSARSNVVQNKCVVAQVVMVGQGYYDPETNKDIPLDVQVGEVVAVNELGLRYYSKFPAVDQYAQDSLAMITDDDIQMKFPNIEAYAEFRKLVNAK